MNELRAMWGGIHLKRLKFDVTFHSGVLLEEETFP